MLITEIWTNGLKQETDDFITSKAVVWDVLPGMPMAEIKFETFEQLYQFMKDCEEVEGAPLRFSMGPCPENKGENEPMVQVIIEHSKGIL